MYLSMSVTMPANMSTSFKLAPKQANYFGVLCGKGGGFSGADFSGSRRLAG